MRCRPSAAERDRGSAVVDFVLVMVVLVPLVLGIAQVGLVLHGLRGERLRPTASSEHEN
jgi:hypothetical protein